MPAAFTEAAREERRIITVRGTVQGVGFRPFVYGMATRLGLRGVVGNTGAGVRIEVEGAADVLDLFLRDLQARRPPLAVIEDVSWTREAVRRETDGGGFRIVHSSAEGRIEAAIPRDVATCEACLAEVFDPADRRYGYAFTNCTHCGPRLTIIEGLPYDRERTTMRRFAMCEACRAEYEDPGSRRFHAQPVACGRCGPRLTARGAGGEVMEVVDPLKWFAEGIRGGRIGAMKGLGGYHLVCDAMNREAVEILRRRKAREEKPFAVMVGDVAGARAIGEVSSAEEEILTSAGRPIVLLRKREGGGIAAAVAPGNGALGVMLPYTPLHHLLLRELNRPLVMTSGNRSDEPIATGEPEVFARLAGIADFYLTHDRPIHIRCDDSVTRVMGGREAPIRRSRGYAPQPLRLPGEVARAMLAVGGQMKGTFALARGREAIVSHHLGDLDHFEAYRAFEKDIAHYERLFAVRPGSIVHDQHPDYASTRYARKRAAEEGIPLIAVQHHHAHIASCMAEHGVDERVIGLAFDGTGYGGDGAIWGGECLIGDYERVTRAAHLRYVPLPGGERAIREPWRMAVAHCMDAGIKPVVVRGRIFEGAMRAVEQMVRKRFNAPPTSSVGRLFDAVAAMIGVRERVSYEGQAAVELEALALGAPIDGAYAFALPGGSLFEIDTRDVIRGVAEDVGRGVSPAVMARRFHTTMVEVVVQVSRRLREESGVGKVVLSGGVFCNALLAVEAAARLRGEGFVVYRHERVPANDGGISLGQLAVAARQSGGSVCV